jgi:hypothetical protein
MAIPIGMESGSQLLSSTLQILDSVQPYFNKLDDAHEDEELSDIQFYEEEIECRADNALANLRLLYELIGAPESAKVLTTEYEAQKQFHARNNDGEPYCPRTSVLWKHYFAAAGALGISEFSEYHRLKDILSNTDLVLQLLSLNPTKEVEINDCLYRVLSLFFPSATDNVSIQSGWKHFKPEFGFTSLRCAVEYKFAKNAAQLRTFVDQIYADMIGYGGSPDWVRFVSVFYCKRKFVTDAQLKQQFADKCAESKGKWEFILCVHQNTKAKK